MLTTEQAADLLLAKMCAGCGTELPAPGLPCTACGKVPAVTRPELAEALAGPGKLAAVEARRLRGEADELGERRSALLAEADRVEHVAVLEHRRTLAEQALGTAQEAEQRAAAALSAAHQAAEDAAADVARYREARDQAANAEEAARRMREGPDAEIGAQARLDAARKVLERYEQALDGAAGAKENARQALDAATAERRRREAERDAAAAEAQNPGLVPVSEFRIGRDLMACVLSPACTPLEKAMAGVIVTGLADLTGVTETIRAAVRDEVLREIAEARQTQTHLSRNHDGTLTGFTPGTGRREFGERTFGG